MIKSKNFNAFTMEGILEKVNQFCKENVIYKHDIISLVIAPNGSITLFYYQDVIFND